MDDNGGNDLSGQLLSPSVVLSRDEVLARPSPVPQQPGVYAWYFDEPPSGVPVEGCHESQHGLLLYVGISPKAPSRTSARPSKQNLRSRIRYHYRGNAAGSTLRLTLGSLLAQDLGIELRRVGSGQRLTFSDGESVISDWMAKHARVCWVETPTPWLLETRLIELLNLPLNLDQNGQSHFREELSRRRAEQRAHARAMPVLPR